MFSTSSRDAGRWPNSRFLNINSDIQTSKANYKGVSRNTVSANFVGPNITPNGAASNYN